MPCLTRRGLPLAAALTVLGAVWALGTSAHAQSVSVNGVMGSKALMVIDGQTQMMSPGMTNRGVKLVSLSSTEALVEIAGQKVSLAVGGQPVNLVRSPDPGSSSAGSGGSRIVLGAMSGGHFAAGGSINGKAVQFLVDTGASAISMSQATADRIGLDYKKGQQTMANTANGAIPVTRVLLASVRIADVEVHDVDAIVLPSAMDYVLLGNTYLSRFRMQRDNDQMVLVRRY